RCSDLVFHTDPAPSALYSLSLHDALPISSLDPPQVRDRAQRREQRARAHQRDVARERVCIQAVVRAHRLDESRLDRNEQQHEVEDRKSTRLNSSHVKISYAVFCLKKKINK